MHHVFVDPQAVPSFHMTQSAVTHLAFKAGSVAVDLHVFQDHLGITNEGLTAVAAQVFLKHRPAAPVRWCGVDGGTGDTAVLITGVWSGVGVGFTVAAVVVTGCGADGVGGGASGGNIISVRAVAAGSFGGRW